MVTDLVDLMNKQREPYLFIKGLNEMNDKGEDVPLPWENIKDFYGETRIDFYKKRQGFIENTSFNKENKNAD